MFKERESFFKKIAGLVNTRHIHDDDDDEYFDDDVYEEEETVESNYNDEGELKQCEEDNDHWIEEENSEGELTIDMCQTEEDIIIQTMVAGVAPDDLDISINREMVTVKGRREQVARQQTDDYFHEELYWGAFSRTVLLPQEIDVDNTSATVQNGLLTITLPKVDVNRTHTLHVDVVE